MQVDKLARLIITFSILISILAIAFVSNLDAALKAQGPFNGPIGDFVNGITTPFLFVAASILAYLNLKEQVKANLVQQQRFEEDKKERWNNDRISYIIFQVTQIKEEIKALQSTTPESGLIVSGHKALYEFSKAFSANPTDAANRNEFMLDQIYSLQVGYIMALRDANRMELGEERHAWVNFVCVSYTTDLKKYVETIIAVGWDVKPIAKGIQKKHLFVLSFLKDNGMLNPETEEIIS